MVSLNANWPKIYIEINIITLQINWEKNNVLRTSVHIITMGPTEGKWQAIQTQMPHDARINYWPFPGGTSAVFPS